MCGPVGRVWGAHPWSAPTARVHQRVDPSEPPRPTSPCDSVSPRVPGQRVTWVLHGSGIPVNTPWGHGSLLSRPTCAAVCNPKPLFWGCGESSTLCAASETR